MTVVTDENYDRTYTSRQLASWALGLSLAVCVPFLPLVGMGLGIAVLVRARTGGGDHGKGKAIAAIVIGSVLGLLVGGWVVIGLVSGFDGAGPHRDDDGNVTERGQIEPGKLQVGDCFNDPNLVSEQAYGFSSELIEVMPCDESHDAEVFHIFELDLAYYPTSGQVDREARACYPAFGDYVGVKYTRSSLVVGWYSPSERYWNYLGDRTVHCLALDRLGNKLDDSVKESGR